MEWKITAEIVATTSLPVDRLTATDCNAAARAKIVHGQPDEQPNGMQLYVYRLLNADYSLAPIMQSNQQEGVSLVSTAFPAIRQDAYWPLTEFKTLQI